MHSCKQLLARSHAFMQTVVSKITRISLEILQRTNIMVYVWFEGMTLFGNIHFLCSPVELFI